MTFDDMFPCSLIDFMRKSQTMEDRTVLIEEHHLEMLTEEITLQLNNQFGNPISENAVYYIAGFIV